MLKKLLKYEFKAQSRTLVPMICSIIVGGFLAALMLTINFRMPFDDGPLAEIMRSSTILLAVILIIAIFASTLVITFLLVQRYYKNFFTDEGYLTFTLPVTTGQHIIAKLIAASVWSVAAGIAFTVAILFLVTFGTTSEGIFNVEFWREFTSIIEMVWKEAVAAIGAGNMALYVTEIVLLAIVSIPSSIMIFYYAMTQGCVTAKKNKILASIGFFFLAQIFIQIVRNTLSTMVLMSSNSFTFLDSEITMSSINTILHISLWINIIVYIGVTVAGFFVCRHLLNKKLNLE